MLDFTGSQNTQLEDANRSSLTFTLLSLLLFLIFFRPEDLMPWTYMLHIPMIVSVLCLLSHIVQSAAQGRKIFALSPIAKMFLFLSLWALLTIPLGFWISGSLNIFVNFWAKMLILFLLLGNAVVTARQVNRVVWICLLSVSMVSLVAVALRLIQGPTTASGRLEAFASGPYSGSNYLSITVLLVLPFALFWHFTEKKLFVRFISAGIVALFAVATLLTQSRAGVLALVVILIAVIWKMRLWGKNPLLLGAGVLLASLPFVVLFGKGVTERFSTVVSDYNLQELSIGNPLRMALGSYQERVQILARGTTLSLQHPITGVGMGNFSSADAHEFFTRGGRAWIASHNTYLQFSSELGIPGLLMYLGLLWLTFKSLREAKQRLRAASERNPDLRRLAIFCDATAVALYGYLITSTFASVAYNCYFFVLAGIAQAICLLALKVSQPVPASEHSEESPAEVSAWWPNFKEQHHGITK